MRGTPASSPDRDSTNHDDKLIDINGQWYLRSTMPRCILSESQLPYNAKRKALPYSSLLERVFSPSDDLLRGARHNSSASETSSGIHAHFTMTDFRKVLVFMRSERQ